MDVSNKMPPDRRLVDLGEWLTYIEQIEEDIACFKTRLEHLRDPRIQQNIRNSQAVQKLKNKQKQGVLF